MEERTEGQIRRQYYSSILCNLYKETITIHFTHFTSLLLHIFGEDITASYLIIPAS